MDGNGAIGKTKETMADPFVLFPGGNKSNLSTNEERGVSDTNLQTDSNWIGTYGSTNSNRVPFEFKNSAVSIPYTAGMLGFCFVCNGVIISIGNSLSRNETSQRRCGCGAYNTLSTLFSISELPTIAVESRRHSSTTDSNSIKQYNTKQTLPNKYKLHGLPRKERNVHRSFPVQSSSNPRTRPYTKNDNTSSVVARNDNQSSGQETQGIFHPPENRKQEFHSGIQHSKGSMHTLPGSVPGDELRTQQRKESNSTNSELLGISKPELLVLEELRNLNISSNADLERFFNIYLGTVVHFQKCEIAGLVICRKDFVEEEASELIKEPAVCIGIDMTADDSFIIIGRNSEKVYRFCWGKLEYLNNRSNLI